jgi:hypothetical protein
VTIERCRHLSVHSAVVLHEREFWLIAEFLQMGNNTAYLMRRRFFFFLEKIVKKKIDALLPTLGTLIFDTFQMRSAAVLEPVLKRTCLFLEIPICSHNGLPPRLESLHLVWLVGKGSKGRSYLAHFGLEVVNSFEL